MGPGAGTLARRVASVIATSPTRLLTINGRDFVGALSSSEAAFSIGWDVTDELLSRSRADGT